MTDSTSTCVTARSGAPRNPNSVDHAEAGDRHQHHAGVPLLRAHGDDAGEDHEHRRDGLHRVLPRIEAEGPFSAGEQCGRFRGDEHDEDRADVDRQGSALRLAGDEHGEAVDRSRHDVVHVVRLEREHAPGTAPSGANREPEHQSARRDRKAPILRGPARDRARERGGSALRPAVSAYGASRRSMNGPMKPAADGGHGKQQSART